MESGLLVQNQERHPETVVESSVVPQRVIAVKVVNSMLEIISQGNGNKTANN